jgi:hypothetical protein
MLIYKSPPRPFIMASPLVTANLRHFERIHGLRLCGALAEARSAHL